MPLESIVDCLVGISIRPIRLNPAPNDLPIIGDKIKSKLLF